MQDSEQNQEYQATLGGTARTLLILSSFLAAFAGCGDRTPPQLGEIRGEPINGLSRTNSVQSTNSNAPGIANSSVPVGPAATGYFPLGFDKLGSFKFDPGEDLLNPQTNSVVRTADTEIPDAVKAFNNKRVSVRGFMLPLKVEGGLVSELLLMRDQSMCCYGVVPKINEWISVKMTGKGVKAIMDQAVTFHGSIHIGEMRENGYLVGIYRLDGERMDLPED